MTRLFSVPRTAGRNRQKARPLGVFRPHIIACFDDTGLGSSAQPLASAPVIGIGEAAFSSGLDAGPSLSWSSRHLSRSIAAIEPTPLEVRARTSLARKVTGHAEVSGSCARTYPPPTHRRKSARKSKRGPSADDNAEVIVLGCAGMA